MSDFHQHLCILFIIVHQWFYWCPSNYGAEKGANHFFFVFQKLIKHNKGSKVLALNYSSAGDYQLVVRGLNLAHRIIQFGSKINISLWL